MQFALAGAKVVLVCPNLARTEETVGQIEAAGGTAIAIASNARTRIEIKAMVGAVLDTFGSLHYAVNNVTGKLGYGLVHEIKERGWDDEIDSTLKRVWLAMKYEIPAIKNSDGGAIVNVASASGLKASPGLSAFGAAKAAVISLSKTAAAEVAQDNVRINSISPGGVETQALEQLWDTEPALKASLASAPAMGRLAKPEEVANCIRFLCSDDSSFMTGDNLLIDGGGVMSKI